MASSSHDPELPPPPLPIPVDLQSLLDWNPPELQMMKHEEGGTAAWGSRKPSFYDKHLTDQLILKRIQYHPDLATQIAGTVDEAIQTALANGGTLPPPGIRLMSKEDRKDYLLSVNRLVSRELPITMFYKEATAYLCLPIASTLALHPRYHKWMTILQWSVAPNTACFAISDASDGSLQFLHLDGDDETAEFRDAIHASMDPRVVETVRKLHKTHPDLAVWEMKSSTVGSAEVMLSLKGLANTGRPFPWVKCTCDGKEHSTDMIAIENTRAGPDAPTTPWKFPKVYEEFSESSLTEESEDEKIGAPVGDDSPIMASPHPTADLTGLSRSSPLTSTDRSETEKATVVPKAKEKQREDNRGPSRIPAKRKHDDPHKEQDTITAGHFLQQVSNAGKPQDTRR